ncbi:epsin-2-like [Acipenser oxyrinchus oxyrinchus]|uniref:Epsin-2-like n=1 Tax=Acipenser oxyrinchus oxyrinchus TaxID=40147 RepID=A0AAD8CRM8_ACIOX|nr:epsin-2-like [Acipenser oxyrinchus oxyrinchus]
MSSFRRQLKKLVKKYSEAEIKVREATSNDPWGPSSSLMSEIADLTYSVSGLAEITAALWERLGHAGRSWRHVFKSLLLLDYLLRAGSERVAEQARTHGACIRDLQGFHYIDQDGKDQGLSVRVKARQVEQLLSDEAALQRGREAALRTRQRLAVGLKSGERDRERDTAQFHCPGCPMAKLIPGEIRPQSKPEEEMQLQIALAESTEEHEQQTESQDSVLSPPSQMRSDPWEHTLMQADNDPWRPAACSTPAEDFSEFDPLRAGSITITTLNKKNHTLYPAPSPCSPRHSSRNWATFPDTPPPPAPRSLFPDLSMAPASCTSVMCLFPGSQSRSLPTCGSQFGCSCAQTGAPALSSLSPHPACNPNALAGNCNPVPSLPSFTSLYPSQPDPPDAPPGSASQPCASLYPVPPAQPLPRPHTTNPFL